MLKKEVISIIQNHKPDLQRYGVEMLSLFGSTARDEAQETSDVDFLVKFNKPIGLFDFFRLQHYLEDLLGVPKVDLVMPGSIKKAFREKIMAEVINVT